jgi:hypothetical protein
MGGGPFDRLRICAALREAVVGCLASPEESGG